VRLGLGEEETGEGQLGRITVVEIGDIRHTSQQEQLEQLEQPEHLSQEHSPMLPKSCVYGCLVEFFIDLNTDCVNWVSLEEGRRRREEG
jgi:hypothetical protein